MEWRRKQLELMLKMFDDNRDKLCDALKQDLGKVIMKTVKNFVILSYFVIL